MRAKRSWVDDGRSGGKTQGSTSAVNAERCMNRRGSNGDRECRADLNCSGNKGRRVRCGRKRGESACERHRKRIAIAVVGAKDKSAVRAVVVAILNASLTGEEKVVAKKQAGVTADDRAVIAINNAPAHKETKGDPSGDLIQGANALDAIN